jgi:cytochrome c oxidase cbb3-type subunit 3
MTPRQIPFGARFLSYSLAAALGVALAGCDRAPSDVRDWSAADHDQPPEADQAPPPGRGKKTAGGGATDSDLVDVAWQKNCADCHGRGGRGDGPKGMGVRAPDLTRADWQAQVNDAQIVATIRSGRGKMPPFPSLPQQVVDGLVKRIRASRAP